MTYINRVIYNIEDHVPRDPPAPCVGQWCCGCPRHPIGKPWGWNHEAWAEHYRGVHSADSLLYQYWHWH